MNIGRVKAIYDEISKYEIKLESDPRSLGPLYLQDIIATCRNYLNAVSRIELEVHREKQDISRSLRASETEYNVAFDHTLSDDERVRRLPSIEDRKATVNVMLRVLVDAIAVLKGQLHDLEYVEKAVRHRHRELTSTMTDIKLQRSLIRDEIDSGAMYGDERKANHERPGAGPLGEEIDMTEIDRLFEEEKAVKAPPAAPSSVALPLVPPSVAVLPVEQLVEVPTDADAIEAFLGTPAKPVEDTDYAALLDSV